MNKIDKTHDARGRGCPMILIELNMAVNSMPVGEILEFLCNDKTALMDIPSWSERTGHDLVEITETGSEIRVLVRKNEPVRNLKRRRNFSQY